MTTGAVSMSQWPSEHRYLVPVAPGPDLVTVTIDGVEAQVRRGELLIRAAQEHGTYIPRFCYHERMKPVGMCRMCLVEIEGMRGLQASCTTPVADGMVVRTQTPAVTALQDGVLELLLVNHPLDCPVCDRGGECPLQDQTLAFGPGESRFVEEKRHFAKPVPLSDLVLLDRERCIQCGRCTRFAAEIAGEALIDFGERGGSTEVVAYPEQRFDSYFSGNTVQICPVGALTAQPYRFKARPWDLAVAETTCVGCAVGCRGSVESSSNRIVRFLGVDSEPVNHGWLCDQGRYGFEWVHHPGRVQTPMVRGGGALAPASWPEALDAVAAGLLRIRESHGPGAIAMLGGARVTNEDAYLWARLMKGVIGTDHVDAQLGDGLPPEVVLGLPRATIADLDRARAIVLLAGDLEEELPVLHLRVRRAAEELDVPLVEVASRASRLAGSARAVVRHLPGEAAAAVAPLVDVLGGADHGSGPFEGLAGALAGRHGPVVVVLGRPSVAEHAGATVRAAAALAALPDVRFLSALHGGNVHGALDLGLAPGFLPGRVSLAAGRAHVGTSWGGAVPDAPGLDAAGILEAAAEGRVRALVLLECDLLTDFPDRRLARRALERVELLVVVGAFADGAAAGADALLATSVWGEHDGSTTNLEGRVQRLAARITPAGTTMAPWRIAAELAARLGTDVGCERVADVQDEIARVAPAFAGVDAQLLRRARDGAVIPVAEHAAELVFARSGSMVPARRWEPIPPIPEAPIPAEALREVPVEGGAVPLAVPPVPLHEWDGRSDEPAVVPVDAYALRLLAGRTLYGDDRSTTRSPSIAGLVRAGRLLLNPADRRRLVTAEGGLLRVSTPDAQLDLAAYSDRSVPHGVAYLPVNREGDGARDLVDVRAAVTELRVETPR